MFNSNSGRSLKLSQSASSKSSPNQSRRGSNNPSPTQPSFPHTPELDVPSEAATIANGLLSPDITFKPTSHIPLGYSSGAPGQPQTSGTNSASTQSQGQSPSLGLATLRVDPAPKGFSRFARTLSGGSSSLQPTDIKLSINSNRRKSNIDPSEFHNSFFAAASSITRRKTSADSPQETSGPIQPQLSSNSVASSCSRQSLSDRQNSRTSISVAGARDEVSSQLDDSGSEEFGLMRLREQLNELTSTVSFQTPVHHGSIIPVQIIREDDGTSFSLKTQPTLTVHEVRMDFLSKIKAIDMVETFKIFQVIEDKTGSCCTEIRVDPNRTIASLINDPIHTMPVAKSIKLKLRKKSNIRWNLPISIEGTTTVRHICVETATSVSNVLEILWNILDLKAEERTSWGLWIEVEGDPKQSGFLDLQSRPFVPWSSASRFIFKRLVKSTVTKLVNMLGIPVCQPLQTIVSQEDKEAEDERRKSQIIAKSAKLTTWLGIDGRGEEFNFRSAMPRKGTMAKALKKKKSSLESMMDDFDASLKENDVDVEKLRNIHLQNRDTRLKRNASWDAINTEPEQGLSTEMLRRRKSFEPIEKLRQMAAEKEIEARRQAAAIMESIPTTTGSTIVQTLRPPSSDMDLRDSDSSRRPSAAHSFLGFPTSDSQSSFKKKFTNFLGSKSLDRSMSRPKSQSQLQIRENSSRSILDEKTIESSSGGTSRKKSSAKIQRSRENKDDDDYDDDDEPVKRTGKLADFFGVDSGQKEMKEIHSIIKTSYTPSKALEARKQGIVNSDGTKVLMRFYFGNMTFTSISLPINVTAGTAIKELLQSLGIKDMVQNFVINEMLPESGGERTVAQEEKLYERMVKWEKDEIFCLKKLKGKNGLRGHRVDKGDDMDDNDSASQGTGEKRVQKLAEFFGVEERSTPKAAGPQAKDVPEGRGELAELYKMLNTMTGTGPSQSNAILNRKIETDNIYKQGALQLEDKKQWLSCYAYVENRFLKVTQRTKDHKEHVYKISLDTSTINKIPFSTHRKHAWQLLDQFGDGLTFAVDTAKDVDAWTSAIATSISSNSVQKPAKSATLTAGGSASKDQPQMSINDFEIHKVIGRGKFAKVLLCIQKSTGTAYAIKVLHKTAEDQCDPQTESNILRSIVHPFIVGLHYAFQSPERLYLVMEYVNGGELYFHICNFGRFSEDRVRFYAAEIFLAIECLHGKGIAYRDLKLENILLAKDGHVKITDFGLSKQEEESDDSSTVSLVGTLEYLAPEVICGLENSFGADWWAFGVVIFEMLCGYHPFYSDDREQIRYNILHSVVEYPDHCSPESKDIISRFLQRNPSLRLGASAADGLEIRSHPFFSSIDFTKLFNKEILPPFRPELDNDLDVRFFDEMFTEEPTVLTPTESAADLGGNEVAGFSFHGKG